MDDDVYIEQLKEELVMEREVVRNLREALKWSQNMTEVKQKTVNRLVEHLASISILLYPENIKDANGLEHYFKPIDPELTFMYWKNLTERIKAIPGALKEIL